MVCVCVCVCVFVVASWFPTVGFHVLLLRSVVNDAVPKPKSLQGLGFI